MEWIKKQQLKVKFLSFINDPTKTNKVFEMVDIASNMKSHEKEITDIENHLLQNKDFKEMTESQWLPTLPKMSYLESCDKDSLGYAYYQHLKSNQLEIDFFPGVKINRPIDYLTYRTYISHDLWHTILGYDTTGAGEVQVQAFALGQIKSGIALMLICAGLVHLLETEPNDAISAFEGVTKAYERGKNSNFLLAYKLEEMLEMPIDEVCKKVGLAD